MERMINNRLTWFLQINDLVSVFQRGFQNRSNIDYLVYLEKLIKETLTENLMFKLESAEVNGYKCLGIIFKRKIDIHSPPI